MANIKISQLPAASAASGTQEFEVNDSGTSKKVTGAQLLSYIDGNHTHTLSEITDAGTAAASDSSDFESAGTSAALATSLSNRNAIINGSMIIDQRSGGGAATVNGGYASADRWRAGNNTNTGTIQQISSTLSGYKNSLKYTASGSGVFFQLGQQIEFANCYNLQNKTVTISFRAKANNTNSGSTAFIVRTRTIAGVDGACIFTGTNSDTSITLTNSDAYYTVTRTLPATFGSLSVEFVLGSHVSGDGFEITGVQLEVGSAATPFEHRSYGDELARCQRYYYRHTSLTYFDGNSGNSTVARGGAKYAVTMRAVPTIAVNSGSNLGGTNGSVYISHTNSTTPISSVQGITVDGFDTISKSSNLPSSSYLYACSFSADAEL